MPIVATAAPMEAAGGITRQLTVERKRRCARSSASIARRTPAAAKRSAASAPNARTGPSGHVSPFAALARVIAHPRLRHK